MASYVVPAPPTSLVQPLNMLSEAVTAAVLHPLPTQIVFILLQLLNMKLISVTFDVLNLPKSRLVSLPHELNMLYIFVTFDVLK